MNRHVQRVDRKFAPGAVSSGIVCTFIPRGAAVRDDPERQLWIYAGVAHLVERHLAKVEVASSSLVVRSRNEKRRCLKEGASFLKHGDIAKR